MKKYPSPCLTCDREYCKRSGSNYKECSAWLTWFRWWWRYFRREFTKDAQPKPAENKFCYEHPDHIRRYLKDGPCKGCPAEATCEKPCPAYLRWWDARMQVIRKKVCM